MSLKLDVKEVAPAANEQQPALDQLATRDALSWIATFVSAVGTFGAASPTTAQTVRRVIGQLLSTLFFSRYVARAILVGGSWGLLLGTLSMAGAAGVVVLSSQTPVLSAEAFGALQSAHAALGTKRMRPLSRWVTGVGLYLALVAGSLLVAIFWAQDFREVNDWLPVLVHVHDIMMICFGVPIAYSSWALCVFMMLVLYQWSRTFNVRFAALGAQTDSTGAVILTARRGRIDDVVPLKNGAFELPQSPANSSDPLKATASAVRQLCLDYDEFRSLLKCVCSAYSLALCVLLSYGLSTCIAGGILLVDASSDSNTLLLPVMIGGVLLVVGMLFCAATVSSACERAFQLPLRVYARPELWAIVQPLHALLQAHPSRFELYSFPITPSLMARVLWLAITAALSTALRFLV